MRLRCVLVPRRAAPARRRRDRWRRAALHAPDGDRDEQNRGSSERQLALALTLHRAPLGSTSTTPSVSVSGEPASVPCCSATLSMTMKSVPDLDLIDEAADVFVVALQRHRDLQARERRLLLRVSGSVLRRDGSRLCCSASCVSRRNVTCRACARLDGRTSL